MISDKINIELLIALAGIISSFIGAKILYFIINKYVKGITEKTKTDIDDRLLAALEDPFVVGLMLIGIYVSLLQIGNVKKNIAFLNNIFFILIVLWAVFVLHRLARVVLERWFLVRPNFQNMPRLVFKTISVFAYLIGFIIILKHFNVEITPLVATLGIGGLAIGLALQDTLSNFFAGLHIVSDKPINIGDFIGLENGMTGYVEDIGSRSTRIRTLANTLVIVPNSKIASTIITNDSLPGPGLSVVVECGVAYSSDLEMVEKITMDVASKIQKSVHGAVTDFKPFMRYHTFWDANINFSVMLRVKAFSDRYLIAHEFSKALKKAYDKNKIQLIRKK